MPGVIATIEAGLKAAEAIAKASKQRDAEKNTAEQRSNAEAKDLQAVRDTAVQAEQNPDQSDINRMTGE